MIWQYAADSLQITRPHLVLMNVDCKLHRRLHICDRTATWSFPSKTAVIVLLPTVREKCGRSSLTSENVNTPTFFASGPLESLKNVAAVTNCPSRAGRPRSLRRQHRTALRCGPICSAGHYIGSSCLELVRSQCAIASARPMRKFCGLQASFAKLLVESNAPVFCFVFRFCHLRL